MVLLPESMHQFSHYFSKKKKNYYLLSEMQNFCFDTQIARPNLVTKNENYTLRISKIMQHISLSFYFWGTSH